MKLEVPDVGIISNSSRNKVLNDNGENFDFYFQNEKYVIWTCSSWVGPKGPGENVRVVLRWSVVGSDLCPPVDVFTCEMFPLAASPNELCSPRSTAGQMLPYSVFSLLRAERCLQGRLLNCCH